MKNYNLWVRIFNYIWIINEAVVLESVYFVTNSSDKDFTKVLQRILGNKRAVVKVGTQGQLACVQPSKTDYRQIFLVANFPLKMIPRLR